MKLAAHPPKYFYIPALLCAWGFATLVSAQDISTVGEIYDYEVNDVFHTKEYGSSVSGGFVAYQNIIITDKFYSSAGDTVFYGRNVAWYMSGTDYPEGITTFSADTIFYTDLDAPIHNGYIDTVYFSEYNGRILNYNYTSDGPFGWHTDKYIEGCGGSYFDNTLINDDLTVHHYLKLIYFKKGTEEWGTPHYVTGVESLTSKSDLRIYPNPASDMLHIDLPEAHHKAESVTVYSVAGRQIRKFDFPSNEAPQIDVSDLDRGLYLIRLVLDDLPYGGRFVKE